MNSNKTNQQKLLSIDLKNRKVLIFLVLLAPLILNDAFIEMCALCQWFIKSLSFYIPGITVMSNTSVIPQFAAFEIALSWIILFLLIIVDMYRAFWSKTLLMQPYAYSNQRFVLAYFGIIAFLIIELTGYFSFYYGSIGVKAKLMHTLLQSHIGLVIFAWIQTVWLSMLLIGWILRSLEILKNLSKNLQENKR
jgi:hypothetical protein